MRTKLGLLALATLAALAVSLLGPDPVAFAEDGGLESAEPAIASGDYTRLPYWLKNSIIVCAARTMDERVAVVKAALRQGYSLKEIGIRHEVRPEALEQGILRCERHFLHRLVEVDQADACGGGSNLQLPRGAHHADHQLPLPAGRSVVTRRCFRREHPALTESSVVAPGRALVPRPVPCPRAVQ
jgi:hypothetical protein